MLRTVLVLMTAAGIGAVGGACSTARIETSSSRRMLDGKEWTVDNLRTEIGESFCYADSELNCRRYGRLYTWESAQQGCASLRRGWRLPTDDEWRALAKHYGGLLEDSDEGGKAAYSALVSGGSSGFNALLGGSRINGQFERLDAHGLYWTASETDQGRAKFYNFGLGGLSLSRHLQGSKQMAISVRCVRE